MKCKRGQDSGPSGLTFACTFDERHVQWKESHPSHGVMHFRPYVFRLLSPTDNTKYNCNEFHNSYIYVHHAAGGASRDHTFRRWMLGGWVHTMATEPKDLIPSIQHNLIKALCGKGSGGGFPSPQWEWKFPTSGLRLHGTFFSGTHRAVDERVEEFLPY